MDVMDAIRRRRSVRRYSSRAIPDDVMERMREALRQAPSACNYQPWRFVIVTDPDARKELAKAAHSQHFIADAPVIVVGVGLPGEAYKRMGGTSSSVDVDVAIALDHLTLAAVAAGLGTCWIGAFVEDDVRRIVNAPRTAKVVAMMPLGYPESAGLIRPVAADQRKPADEVFVSERFA